MNTFVGEYEREGGATRLSPTARIAAWSARHRWWVVAASIATFVLAMTVLSTVETKLLENVGDEGEAGAGFELMEERFEDDSRPTETLVFYNPSLDATAPEYRATVESLVGRLRALPEVESVASYYDTNDESMVSEGGNAVLAQIVIETPKADASDNVHAIVDAVRDAPEQTGGFEIAIAGNESINAEITEIIEKDFANILLITMVLGLVILLIVFRAVVAAVIPLILAIGSIFSATAVAAIVSQAFPLDESYSEMILLMGMAVGIDYSLFIVSRYRSERLAGRQKLDAIAVASNTTGRTVLYAGITVVLSLTGLMLTNNPIFISLALAAVIVVMLAMVGSVTLLPALLSVLGDNINRLRLPYIGRERPANNGGGIWGAITDRVLARPAVFAIIITAGLIALALPVTSLNLGFNSGSAAIPKAAESRRAVELLEDHFGLGVLSPAVVVVDAPDVGHPEVQTALDRLIATVERDESFVGPFEVRSDKAGSTLLIEVPTVGEIDDTRAEEAITHLRGITATTFADSGSEVYVTGATAGSLDFKNHMYRSAPTFSASCWGWRSS